MTTAAYSQSASMTNVNGMMMSPASLISVWTWSRIPLTLVQLVQLVGELYP